MLRERKEKKKRLHLGKMKERVSLIIYRREEKSYLGGSERGSFSYPQGGEREPPPEEGSRKSFGLLVKQKEVTCVCKK